MNKESNQQKEIAVGNRKIDFKYRIDEIETDRINIGSVISPTNTDAIHDALKLVNDLGLFRSVVVFKDGENYVFEAGSAELLTAKTLNLSRVRCCILEQPCPEELKYIIDCQSRRNPHPILESRAMTSLVQNHQLKGCDIAKILNRSESYVSETCSISRLPEDILLDCLNCNVVPKLDCQKF